MQGDKPLFVWIRQRTSRSKYIDLVLTDTYGNHCSEILVSVHVFGGLLFHHTSYPLYIEQETAALQNNAQRQFPRVGKNNTCNRGGECCPKYPARRSPHRQQVKFQAVMEVREKTSQDVLSDTEKERHTPMSKIW